MRRTAATAVLAGAALVAVGCGETKTRTVTDPAPAPQAQGGGTAPQDPLAVPRDVPTSPTGPAPAADRRVIRTWAGTLRGGDEAGAADVFADRVRVQNGSPPLRLTTRAERIAFNHALPCGAVPVAYRAAKDWTLTAFRLTSRKGGECGSGAGNPAFVAIRVRDGRIVDWIRLPTPAPSSGSNA